MPGENSREAKIKASMEELGIYHQAFDGAVHSLAIAERELSRARKEWKKTATDGKSPSFSDPHYAVIERIEGDIAALRDSLGLTPKGLRRLRGLVSPEGGAGGTGSADGALAGLEAFCSQYSLEGDGGVP